MGLKSARTLKEYLSADAPGQEPELFVVEKSAERRVTTGVMYMPDRPDAHGEYASAEDLEDAVHDFMEAGDLRIRKQHGRDVIGSIVGMMAWPFEQEVELKPANGLLKAKSVTLPAGTVYTTVKWTPVGWSLVKSRKVRGLSMGGTAVRLRT